MNAWFRIRLKLTRCHANLTIVCLEFEAGNILLPLAFVDLLFLNVSVNADVDTVLGDLFSLPSYRKLS